MGARIIVVDDDPNVCEVLRLYLERANAEVLCLGNGAEFYHQFRDDDIDLIILDLMLPDRDGFAICQEVRKKSAVPIIILSARGAESDRIKGLDLGADDYVSKPFSPLEVVSRVNALLRRVVLERARDFPARGAQCLDFPGLSIDLAGRLVRVNGDPVRMTAREFEILSLLVRERGTVVSRDRILKHVWGYNSYVSGRTIDVHIKWLRDKLGVNSQYRYLHTVHGVGYKFEVQGGP